ncbi:MAG: DUF2244 domain-containing protein [Rhodobacteraceae bacterium]|mgnify:CR=1 FL=1|jgi:uncharacterized membrane protein|nr:DUF2244 domain-containing protein [Paracoccaceae bacterium]
MPYEWLPPQGDTQRLHLWPHRSLSPRGFVSFVGGTAALIGVPALALVGSPVLWALLPFLVGAVWAIWFALRKNARDRSILEELTLAPATVHLARHDPQGRRDWEANTHWVQVDCHPTGGPVPNYLTLRGGSREVEIGAFLTEEERRRLRSDLEAHLTALR